MTGIIRNTTIETKNRVVSGTKFDYHDLTQQADDYLAAAKKQADELLASAQEERAAIREEARQAGWEDAKREAEAAAMARVDAQLGSLLPAVQQTISSVQELRQQWTHRWEKNALTLALGIAERIVRREIARDVQITHAWIREALELASGCQHIRLRLNPHDYQLLQNQTQSLEAEFTQLADAEIVPDDSISAGGCCIDTEFGCIDQQIETQLARIGKALG